MEDVLDEEEADDRKTNRRLFNEWSKEKEVDIPSLPNLSAHDNQLSFHKLHKLQDMYYALDLHEHPSEDDKCTIKRHVKKIYRNVKFFSDKPHEFDEPNFAYSMSAAPNGADVDLKQQTVQIAEILMNSKEPTRTFDLKTKIFWWKGYRDLVRKEFNRLRQAEVRGFLQRFVNGKINHLQYIVMKMIILTYIF